MDNNEARLRARIHEEFPHLNRLIIIKIVRQHFGNSRVGTNGAHQDYIGSLVAAFIRHNLTEYDNLYRLGFDKLAARRSVQAAVSHQLAAWR